MRRPRAGFVTPSPGGPGQAVRWHYDRLPSMAGRGGDEGRRKPPGSGAPQGPVAARKHGARDRKAAMARREAPRLRKKARTSRNGSVFSARHPLVMSKRGKRERGRRAYPAPTQRIRATMHVRGFAIARSPRTLTCAKTREETRGPDVAQRQDALHHRRLARHRPRHRADARPPTAPMSPSPPRPSSRIPSWKAPSTPPPRRSPRSAASALPLAVDVRDEAAVKDAIERTAAHFGGIDIVVNNASAISLTPVAQTDMRRFDLMQQINARGTFMVSKYAIPHLLKSQQAAHPHAVAAARHAGQMVRAAHRLFHGQVRHEHGGARPVRRTARQGRGQRAVAAHHHRHRRDQEPARRRRHDEDVAQAGDPGGRRLAHLPEAGRASAAIS